MLKALLTVGLVSVTLLSGACSSSVRFSSGAAGERQRPPTPHEKPSDNSDSPRIGATFRGKASYYADKFEGRPTASGEIFKQSALTAAHRTLPFGTKVRVRNLVNERTVTVRINDRGPFVSGRIIDLSRAAAKALDMIRIGVAPVEITILE